MAVQGKATGRISPQLRTSYSYNINLSMSQRKSALFSHYSFFIIQVGFSRRRSASSSDGCRAGGRTWITSLILGLQPLQVSDSRALIPHQCPGTLTLTSSENTTPSTGFKLQKLHFKLLLSFMVQLFDSICYGAFWPQTSPRWSHGIREHWAHGLELWLTIRVLYKKTFP